jgi:hypothetical protein
VRLIPGSCAEAEPAGAAANRDESRLAVPATAMPIVPIAALLRNQRRLWPILSVLLIVSMAVSEFEHVAFWVSARA